MVRRMLVAMFTFVVVTAVVVVGAGASTGKKVGPDQYFGALVNGHNGVAAPALIQMACFGPIRPGETGHPMAGQTVEVVLPVSTAGSVGFTGANANSIVAFFGAPPPTATGVGPSASNVTFKHYGVAKKIPTSLVLPCAGTGNVFFVPLPMSPPSSRAATVRVSYLGQP
jgi:hypothetical protein